MSHILSELGFAVRRDGDGFRGTAEIVPEMWVPGTTSLRTSIVATWIDWVAGVLSIDTIAPRVPVTLELDAHVYEHLPSEGPIHAVARLLKAGRTVVVCGVDILDGAGEPVAVGTASFMAAPDPGFALPRGDEIDAWRPRLGQLRQPFAERAGCVRTEPGVATLGRSEDGLNASDSINGGLIALAVEEAALSLTPGETLASLAMRYLRPVRVGPAVATAQVRAGLGQVDVRDAGDQDRPAVAATSRVLSAGGRGRAGR
jgi:acyl-coenzyme A thioesterase PaaI-like protein